MICSRVHDGVIASIAHLSREKISLKQNTYQEVHDQFVAVLKAIHIDSWGHSAHGGAEYISFADYDQNTKLTIPKGALRVMVRPGNC